MSRKNNKKQNSQKGNFKVPSNVKAFANATFKGFKKENPYYDKKKEYMKAYYEYLMELLPDALKFVVRYGHNRPEEKGAIYEKLIDVDFVESLQSKFKKKDKVSDEMKLLAAVTYDMIQAAEKDKAAARKAAEENGEDMETYKDPDYDLSDVVELAKVVLKKPIKKLVKKGIPEQIAFDVLSIVPSDYVLEKNAYFRTKLVLSSLYEHAKTVDDVKFDVIANTVFKDHIEGLIVFCLLEHKSRLSNMIDNQIKLFNDITKWCLSTLEDMDKKSIEKILILFAQTRKRDEQQNRDSQRRFFISSISNEEYPKLRKVVDKIIDNDEQLKKYF